MNTRTQAACLQSAMAEPIWTQEPDELGYQRHRAVDDARRHLASLTPERRAMLEQEWK